MVLFVLCDIVLGVVRTFTALVNHEKVEKHSLAWSDAPNSISPS